MERQRMRKFEVCIRGDNFLVKTGKTVKKNGFRAARCVEARDNHEAVALVMNSLKRDLKGIVLNDKSDPPDAKLEEVSEVYYFKDEMAPRPDDPPGKGIEWDEPIAEDAFAAPVGAVEKRWLALQNRIAATDLHVHAICIHFTSALYPVSVLFMLLYLVFGKTSFDQTHFYLLILATLSAPASYFTGLFEWRQRYERMELPVFTAKIRFSIAVFAVGLVSTLWRAVSPGVLDGGGLRVLYVLLNIAQLPMLVYLGYLGGMVLYERLDKKGR